VCIEQLLYFKYCYTLQTGLYVLFIDYSIFSFTVFGTLLRLMYSKAYTFLLRVANKLYEFNFMY